MASGTVKTERHRDGTDCLATPSAIEQGSLCWMPSCRPHIRFGVSFLPDLECEWLSTLARGSASEHSRQLRELARQHSAEEREVYSRADNWVLRVQLLERRVARAEVGLADAQAQLAEVSVAQQQQKQCVKVICAPLTHVALLSGGAPSLNFSVLSHVPAAFAAI